MAVGQPLSSSSSWLMMTIQLALLLILLLSSSCMTVASAFAADKINQAKILVTGAGGNTGRLVFEALLNDPTKKFEPIALVRSEASAKKLRHDIPQTGLAQIIVCDIASLAAAGGDLPSFDDGLLGGCKAMVICTSAVPVIMKRSLFKALLLIPWNVIRGKKAIGFDTFRFKWKMGQTPQQVDYQGQKAQIDVARQLGMERVVLLSSMGGCDPNHPLNKIGKNPVDGSGDGDILLWKQKAEQYLVQSGLDYVIIHPGGLTDGPGGQNELVIDVDDKLIARHKQGEDGIKRSIHRADVAALCVAALTEGKNYAFDCVAGTGTSSASSSFDTQESTFVSAKETLRSFVKKTEKAKKPNKVYSYSP